MQVNSRARAPRQLDRGCLITFEGIGGSGKSTLAKRLAATLAKLEFSVVATREPGGTDLGAHLRELLLGMTALPDPWTEAFLFEADRAQTYAEIIAPSLAEGHIVVSDRGPFGTIAYQGFGRGLDLDTILAMNSAARRGMQADLVFVVDIEPAVGLRRKQGATEVDRFDTEAIEFQSLVRQGYLWAASSTPEAHVVDGSSSEDELFGTVYQLVTGHLENDHRTRLRGAQRG